MKKWVSNFRDVDLLVAQLHDLRNKASNGQGNIPRKLPSTKELNEIVEDLSSILFPNRLGMLELREEGIDDYVGSTLENVLSKLYKQVHCELNYACPPQNAEKTDDNPALTITNEFAKQLPAVRALMDSDIKAAFEGDPAARSPDEVLICYPGVKAIMLHRLAHILYRLGGPLIARIISEIAHSQTGIDIHPGAQIGEGFFIDHGTGVVIGETTIIGRNVRLYHAVTLGAKRFQVDQNGILSKGEPRHPIIEDDVVIYAGATILGRITIGRRSIIGGNVWLTHSVPADSSISQAKVRSELFQEGAGI